jgi:hypothetical protein
MPAIRKIDAADVIRKRRAGFSVTDIAEKAGVSRQAIYVTLSRAPKLKAAIRPTDVGFLVVAEDLPAAATAIRNALLRTGWEVEG